MPRLVLGHDDVPYTFAFQVHECGDPACGIHLISLNEQHSPICETVLSPAQMDRLIKHCQEILRHKEHSHELPSPRTN